MECHLEIIRNYLTNSFSQSSTIFRLFSHALNSPLELNCSCLTMLGLAINKFMHAFSVAIRFPVPFLMAKGSRDYMKLAHFRLTSIYVSEYLQKHTKSVLGIMNTITYTADHKP